MSQELPKSSSNFPLILVLFVVILVEIAFIIISVISLKSNRTDDPLCPNFRCPPTATDANAELIARPAVRKNKDGKCIRSHHL